MSVGKSIRLTMRDTIYKVLMGGVGDGGVLAAEESKQGKMKLCTQAPLKMKRKDNVSLIEQPRKCVHTEIMNALEKKKCPPQ